MCEVKRQFKLRLKKRERMKMTKVDVVLTCIPNHPKAIGICLEDGGSFQVPSEYNVLRVHSSVKIEVD